MMTSPGCGCPLASLSGWQREGQPSGVEMEEGCLNVIGFDWHVLRAPLHHWLSACLLNHCWFPPSLVRPVTRVVSWSEERGQSRRPKKMDTQQELEEARKTADTTVSLWVKLGKKRRISRPACLVFPSWTISPRHPSSYFSSSSSYSSSPFSLRFSLRLPSTHAPLLKTCFLQLGGRGSGGSLVSRVNVTPSAVHSVHRSSETSQWLSLHMKGCFVSERI